MPLFLKHIDRRGIPLELGVKLIRRVEKRKFQPLMEEHEKLLANKDLNVDRIKKFLQDCSENSEYIVDGEKREWLFTVAMFWESMLRSKNVQIDEEDLADIEEAMKRLDQEAKAEHNRHIADQLSKIPAQIKMTIPEPWVSSKRRFLGAPYETINEEVCSLPSRTYRDKASQYDTLLWKMLAEPSFVSYGLINVCERIILGTPHKTTSREVNLSLSHAHRGETPRYGIPWWWTVSGLFSVFPMIITSVCITSIEPLAHVKSHYWYHKGINLERSKKYEAAIKCYEKLLRFDRNNADAWAHLGDCHRITGKYKKAIQNYQKAKMLDPSMDVWYHLGYCYRVLNRRKVD